MYTKIYVFSSFPFAYYTLFFYNAVGVKRYFAPLIPTDCSALCAPAGLRSNPSHGCLLCTSCFSGLKVILFSCKHETYAFCPRYHIVIYLLPAA